MEYAVVEVAGKQYRVNPGDTIDIDSFSGKEGKIEFDRVLMHVSDGEVKLGKPYLTGVVVAATVLSNFKGKKVRVSRFTAKSRHRRVIGFRSAVSRVQIDKIATAKAAPAKETKEPKTKKA